MTRAITQGEGDWWMYLLEEERSGKSAVALLAARLAAGDPDGPFGHVKDPAAQLLMHRGCFGETILHQCILAMGTNADIKPRKVRAAQMRPGADLPGFDAQMRRLERW